MRELSIGVLEDLTPTLGPKQVENLCARGTPLQYSRNELIYRQGEPATHVYLLLEGQAQSTLLNSSGNEILLRIHLPGSILGLTSLASVPRRDASAKAIEPSRLARIGRNDLEDLIRGDSVLGLSLIQLLVDRMRDFHFRVGDLQAQSVEQRLARVLLAISRRTSDLRHPGHKPEIHLTHEKLAQLVNSRRQTVTAILGRFAQAGYVTKVGRRFVIEDARGLTGVMP
jgi:CRP-like cAMP-binding protein